MMRNQIENKREVPENKPEKLEAVELTPEEVGIMVEQLPAYQEMLAEREAELSDLSVLAAFPADAERIKILKTEIEELREEIEGREDASEGLEEAIPEE